MKKILSIIFCFCLLCTIASCAEKTEFEDKTIDRIETIRSDGFGLGFIYKRIFDFTNCTVSDITIADEGIIETLKNQYENNPEYYKDFSSLEEFEDDLNSRYNTLKEVITFTEEEGKAFLKEIISLGIYDWKENYITDEIIHDAAGVDINIIFTDGTEKGTHIYFKSPKNYDSILNAFKKYFNVGCWMGSK